MRERENEQWIQANIPSSLLRLFPLRTSRKTLEEIQTHIRRHETSSEKKFAKLLSDLGYANFSRNRQIAGRFIVDFAFRRERIILELNSPTDRNNTPKRRKRRKLRDGFITLMGWAVHRVEIPEILDEAVATEKIQSILGPAKERIGTQLSAPAAKKKPVGFKVSRRKEEKIKREIHRAAGNYKTDSSRWYRPEAIPNAPKESSLTPEVVEALKAAGKFTVVPPARKRRGS